MNPMLDLSTGLQQIRQSAGALKPFRIEDLPNVWTLDARTEWLVDGLIPSGALTLLSGDSGVGKSTLALALAGAVAHGTPFLGLPVRQNRVLYVDGENPLGTIRERLDRLQIAQTNDLYLWGGWHQEHTPAGPHALSVFDFAREHRGLIIYDSLIGFHPGSEQDASETRRYLQHYRTLANTGAAVFLIAHSGKAESSKQYRGSSDIKAAVDQAYCLELMSDVDAGTRALRLTPFKTRIAELAPFSINWSSTGGFELGRASSRTNRELVEDIIRRNPDLTGRVITGLAASAGVAKNRCEELLANGADNGWLIVNPGPRNSKLYRCRET
jgi:AAA domain